MKIIFMGTPEFAVASLRILVDAGYEVVGVVTAPDRPAGRGRQLTPSAVKEFALERGLRVLQPEKLKDPAWLAELESLQPDLAVVVAFRMLPKVVWSVPKMGTFNLHASLLPDYRGAAPINWALINGEKETGVTTFFIDQQIDTGDLLFQKKVNIPAKWSVGDLHHELMDEGAKLVLKTVKAIEAGTAERKPQNPEAFLHPAPKIFKDDCRIDWNQPVEKIYNFIRGLSPYPCAWTTLNGKVLKIQKSSLSPGNPTRPGTVKFDGHHLLEIAGNDGWLQILKLQLEGKKPMEAGEFLRGYKEKLETVK
ncbi:MAG: methionyl-tRNA formyltransferase [Bacteroidia bacterium]|nr:methionyl-tRNA formyltransferase [Bacteroidia bacterium]